MGSVLMIGFTIQDEIAGFRFLDVSLPSGAYIVNSHLQFTKQNIRRYFTNGSIWGELDPDSQPPHESYSWDRCT